MFDGVSQRYLWDLQTLGLDLVLKVMFMRRFVLQVYLSTTSKILWGT